MKESIKNFLTDGVGRVVDYFCLNLIFILTCLPVITVGASCTALYYVIFHMMAEEDSHLTRKYFKTWKECFGKSTVGWLIGLVACGLIYMAFRAMAMLPMKALTVVMYAFLIILFYMVCSILIYYFSLHARFENTIGGTMKNALILTVSHLPVSFACFMIFMAPFVILSIVPTIGTGMSCFMILFGFALQGRLQSGLLFPLYKSFTPEEETEEEEAW